MNVESKIPTHDLGKVTNTVVLNLFYSSTNLRKGDIFTTETMADSLSDLQPVGHVLPGRHFRILRVV